MTRPTRLDPGAAAQDLDTSEVSYDELAGRVWTAMNATIDARAYGDPLERDIEQVLRAMRETHESMRSVYSMAARFTSALGSSDNMRLMLSWSKSHWPTSSTIGLLSFKTGDS